MERISSRPDASCMSPARCERERAAVPWMSRRSWRWGVLAGFVGFCAGCLAGALTAGPAYSTVAVVVAGLTAAFCAAGFDHVGAAVERWLTDHRRG